jgi:hypothetical protein
MNEFLKEEKVVEAAIALRRPEVSVMVPEIIEAEMVMDNTINIPTLTELGFGKAVTKIDRARKLKVAYAKYGFVTEEAIQKFNEKLKKETLKEDSSAYHFKQLAFYAPQNYGEIPPQFVLDKMKDAAADNVFDSFEIAKIDWKVEIKDPILFGRIEGCTDRFFIAQWDDDVSIEDIILADV